MTFFIRNGIGGFSLAAMNACASCVAGSSAGWIGRQSGSRL